MNKKKGMDNVFEVDRILNKKVVKGKVKYFIKWEGYPDDQNTWEPESNVLDRKLITEFENRRSKNSKKKDNESVAPVPKRSETHGLSMNNSRK